MKTMEYKDNYYFSGDYLCSCIKEYCDKYYKDGWNNGVKITDRLVYQYYMSVSEPLHIDVNNIRICTRK